MPQLSPMIGVLVFVLTNLAFTTVVMSIRPYFSILPSSSNTLAKTEKAFRSFS
uniref:ATP synthase F0 subunit 8 n=1 Tax=Elysia atroviridis TaxID=1247391 RepID=UPI00208DFD7D|nr:ATP synthase F0 subunit 8 [Elysia atroviridis]USC52129.1 ATP synthase F0 subunit 8 [Elysia atroviridis]